MLDIFNSDAFGYVSLSTAINKLIYTPSQIGGSGLFTAEGINTTTAIVELQGNTLQLVDVQPRGANGQAVTADKRTAIPFIVPHIPQRATILAEQIQNIRDFGSETATKQIQAEINKRLLKMRTQIDYTIEQHRLSAMMGLYYLATGGTASLFTIFGLTQQSLSWALGTSTTKLKVKVKQTIDLMESQLDGIAYTGVKIYAGKTWFENFIAHADFEAYYKNSPFVNQLNANPMNAVEFMGVTVERYRGDSTVKIPDNEAYAVPLGVTGLLVTKFAPADYMETVNTIGAPYYAKSELMDFAKGVTLESQSNPLNICTIPSAIIKLTVA
jgi:hypothetical protein